LKCKNIFTAKHKAPLSNSVSRIIHNNSSSIGKHQEFCLLDALNTTDARLHKHKLHPAPAAGAGFTNIIYTKLSTFPSREISGTNDTS